MRKFLFFLVALLGMSCATIAQPCTGSTTRIGGVVFNDFDENGVKNTNETRQAGITINVYNNSGTLVGTDVSDTDGDWFVNVPTPPSVSDHYRVEFSLSAALTASGLRPSANGTENKSDVQFISAASCAVDFGVNYVGDYCNANPDLLVACFVTGDPLPVGSTIRDEAAIVRIPYNVAGGTSANPSPVAPVYVAQVKEVGSVFGAAYQRETKKIFSAAFLKRHAGLGGQGLGGVYLTDVSSATPVSTNYFDLESFGYDLGQSTIATRSLPASGTASSPDLTAFDAVGKIGLGGMDIAEDGGILYITDLFNKQLFIVNIGNPAKATITASDITTVPIPSTTCPNGVARPFSVTYNKGKVYVGVVCTGENSGTVADVSASVYVLDPLSNTFNGTAIFSMSMNYTKGAVHTSGNWLPFWRPWVSTFEQLSTNGTVSSNPVTTRTGLPQPMLCDIAFTDDGDMILGFMDRVGHQLGYKQVNTTGTGNYSGYVGGDILRTHFNGTAWVLENNGAVGSLTSAGGVGNGEGPGGGEFYNNDNYLTTHEETFMGGMTIVPGTNAVVGTFMDPLNTWSGGFSWFSNTDGANLKDYQIYATQAVGGAATNGKANGLGAIKTTCAAAPIEIGNYVWIDADKDGIQDPNETPLPNVTVKLYKTASGATSLVAATSTDATGNYYFKDYNEFGVGFDTLTPNAQYHIVLGEGGQWSPLTSQLTIGGVPYVLTQQNAAASNDQNDTDAFIFATAGKPFTNYPVDTVTIPSAGGGYVNHTLDFGLVVCPNITDPSSAQTICAGTAPTDLTVNTNQNAPSSIRFVRFSSNQIAGATPTAAELWDIYTTGTSLATVSPTGGASPYTATFTPSATDFPNATASNVTYYVYAVLNPDLGAACRAVQEIVVTVKPTPTTTITPSSQAVCNGISTTAVAFMGTVVGTTYTWTNNTTSIGLAASGTDSVPAFTGTNTGATPVTATISVTPSANGCATAGPTTFTVTVNPTPSVTSPSNRSVCNNATVSAITWSGSAVASTTYTWTNNTPSIGLAASGTGNIAAFTAVNATSSNVVATITVTPTANGCSGTPRTFTITVKPTPSVFDPSDQVLCPTATTTAVILGGSTVAGTTYAWANNTPSVGLAASGSATVPSFTALNATASPVVATITATPTANGCVGAPQDFTITVNPSPTFTTTKTDPSVCGVTDGTIALNDLLNNTSYTVSYTFNGATVSNVLLSNGTGTINLSGLSAGSYSKMVVLRNGCSTTPTVSVTLTDPAAPTVDPVANINVCPNGTVTAVNFTGTGSPTFSWTNNNPSIGLAASGTGNIAAFTANNVSTEQVAHIVVTPNNGSCIGTAIAFDITVNKPTVVEPLDVSVCASGTVNAVTFNGSIGATFDWTNDNTNTGLTASGTGTIGSFTAANVATTEISTITVTPIVSGCAGDAQTFTLTVDPSPTVTVPANLTVCAETMVNALTFSGSVGAIFHWTNDNSATGLATSGTGDIATFAAATLTTTTVSTITVTPVLNGCTGTPQVFTLTVRPIPEVTTPTNIVVCTGSTVVASAFSGTSGAAFSWVNDNTNTGLLASNMGNIANFTTANTSTQQVSIVTVTPVLNGCSGVPKPFTLTVNPLPVFTISNTNPTTCSGVDGAMTLTGLQNNTTYTVSYTLNSVTTTNSFTSNGAGVILISGLGSGDYSGVITDLNGCASVAQSATLTDPLPPSVSQPIGKVACGGGPVVGTTFVGTAGATFNWTNSNTAVGLGASGQSNISAFLVPNVATNQLATVTITPVKNGCIGATQSFTILVRANPNVNSVTPLSYCSTDAVSAIAFTSTPVGATFNWTNNNTATGLAASNAGTIAPFTAAAVTTLQRSIITVVPTLAGCVGAPSAVVLDINPFVSAGTAVATPPVCLSGSGLTTIDLSSKLTDVTATGVWTDVSTVSAGNRFSSADATLDPNGLPVGIYTFRYTVAGVAPCPNDAEEVTIIINMCCPPIICLPATVVRSN